MTDNPLVSVLLTAYNRKQFIAEAILSVIGSTYQNWELIIVDDCSTDDTYKIAQEFEKLDGRVKAHRNDSNLGQFENRNKAADYAKGKYIKYLDSDDVIFQDGLEYCVTEMEKHPHASIGLVTFKKMDGKEAVAVPSQKAIRNHYFKESSLYIGPTGTIIRRDCFELNNGFDTRFGVASDNYFNIQLAMLGDVVFMPYQYFYYRQHEGQEINNAAGYLVYNFLYSKELFANKKLPLAEKEIVFLERKLEKRHSVNLMKYFIRTKSIKKVSTVMRLTHYSLPEFFKGFFK